MNTQDVASELNHPGAQELLTSATVARLAYTGKDGFPRVIPIGFYWNGEAVIVAAPPISPKVAAMSAQPHVALTIDTAAAPWKQLLIRGTVEIEIVDGIPPEYLRASEKAMPKEQWEQFAEQVRGMYPQMARITVVPAWAKVFDFSTGRLPAFLQRLAAERARREAATG